jgi:hypothetical protein
VDVDLYQGVHDHHYLLAHRALLDRTTRTMVHPQDIMGHRQGIMGHLLQDQVLHPIIRALHLRAQVLHRQAIWEVHHQACLLGDLLQEDLEALHHLTKEDLQDPQDQIGITGLRVSHSTLSHTYSRIIKLIQSKNCCFSFG